MPCATIIIVKLIKSLNHVYVCVCVCVCVCVYVQRDDILIYTFHLALSSPIKISMFYITCCHIIELKLEIKTDIFTTS